MSKYCFYKGDDTEVIARLREAANYCWGAISEFSLDSFRLFIAAEDCERSLGIADNELGAVGGYATSRDPETTGDGGSHNTIQYGDFVRTITRGEWPLGDNWTGSFAAAAYSKSKREVTLCNDIIGHIALYYAQVGKGLIGGTSLIALGRALRSAPDPVGIVQKITPPYCNYGRRTLLKNVFRILPGERLKWISPDSGFRSDFDNSLCNDLTDIGLSATARTIWDCLQGEILAAVGPSDKISVATSGGLDSRLVLGGLAGRGLEIRCLTYGNEQHYETRIARRCAEAIGASHECFSIEGKYFPSRKELEPLIRETESGNYMEWFGIIERAKASGEKRLLLLGDLCESIDGRYITTYSSRKARIASFVRGLSGEGDSFSNSTGDSFRRWAEAKQREIIAAVLANWPRVSGSLTGNESKERITAEIESDLDLSFARVRDNMVPLAELYDELFIWFHRIRFLLGNQITWLGSAFFPVSPGMSMRFLRLVTNVHPRLRLRKKLMSEIMKFPEFDDLARIPSAQIPFVHSRRPNLIREIVWGTRSTLDKLMIQRALKKKKPGARQRVLRSLDYIKEYQRDTSGNNVKSWFSETHIESEGYLKSFRSRAELSAWPLINVDIAAPANVAITLDLCHPENCSAHGPRSLDE